jgi:hypothetical protein
MAGIAVRPETTVIPAKAGNPVALAEPKVLR